jgi:HEAT repeat protein
MITWILLPAQAARCITTRMRRWLVSLWFPVLVVSSVAVEPALDATDEHAVELALRAIKMSPRDLAFKKDYAESELVLEKSRRSLQQPLALAGHAGLVASNLQGVASLDALAVFSHKQLEIQMPRLNVVSPKIELDDAFVRQLPAPLARAAQTILSAASAANELLQQALPAEQIPAFSAFALDTLHWQQDRDEPDAGGRLGIPADETRQLLARAENLELQDDELAHAILAASDKLDRARLFWAFRILASAVDRAIADLRTNSLTGEFQAATDTPLGKIIAGGGGSNLYTNDALLIIDTGGDDRYENSAGAANGLPRQRAENSATYVAKNSAAGARPISVVIDLAGNDRYGARRSFSQGAGLFGIGILVDLAGDDVYEARHLSQGAGFFGCGLLADFGGNDRFEADTFCQGAGMFGAGILWQRGGDTSYRAGQIGQGFGGTGGIGLLFDEAGNDSYSAGGKYPCHWLPGRNFSLAQGFGYGMRPFAGGGVGILADLAGDDRFLADVYGQGASYWYSVGLLLDGAGDDSYQAHQYCQGAGIHLSNGALVDWAGNDSYVAGHICQGAAHDYSVGMLIDRAGHDKYGGESTAQGSAINNSFALLLDVAGDDSYIGKDPTRSQAAGHDGGRRESGSIALMLDLAGQDDYSQGQTNNMVWIKPWYGAGMDWEMPIVGAPFWARSDGVDQTASRPEGRSYKIAAVDPHHPIERLLRRAIREPDTEEHRKDSEVAWDELKKRGAEALPYLLTRLDSPNVLVRAKTEDLIDFIGTNSVPALVAGIDTANNDEVARLCAYFLARFETATNAAPRLLPLLERENTRAMALYALGHLKAREAFEPALAALADEQELVRLRAAQAVGRILSVGATSSSRPGPVAAGRPLPQTHRAAVSKLIAALDDEMWSVRYAAQDALVAIGKPSIEPLCEAFATAGRRARPHIIEALAKLGDQRAFALAGEYYGDENPLVRDAIERSLHQP